MNLIKFLTPITALLLSVNAYSHGYGPNDCSISYAEALQDIQIMFPESNVEKIDSEKLVAVDGRFHLCPEDASSRNGYRCTVELLLGRKTVEPIALSNRFRHIKLLSTKCKFHLGVLK